MKKNNFEWLMNWYSKNCDGDWEHYYGVEIGTLDNPGWRIIIDLDFTDFEFLEIKYEYHEKNETDWWSFKIENKKYDAAGDPSKLDFLIYNFRKILEKNDYSAQ